MELNGTIALTLAQSAFGDTAKIRTIANAPDPANKYRIAYIPAHQETPTVVGYGADWVEAFQMAFISERGKDRIAAVAGNNVHYIHDAQRDTLAGVMVSDGQGNTYSFEYDELAAPSWLPTHPNTSSGPVAPAANVFAIANAISKTAIAAILPVKHAAVTVEVPAGAAATVSAANTAKTAIPKAYVNPNNIKTGLMGWDDEVVGAAVLAAVTGEHLLIIGTPGGAKSLFTRRFFAHFEGRLFETQLSKYSDETALFGAPNLKKLREDGIFEYPKHGIANAEWGFLDEVFDASDVMLRTMLSILQEKKFTKGGHEEDIPLQSVIATANYTRVNDITAAVVDRFAITVASPTLTVKQREMLYGKTSFEEVPKIQNVVGLDQLRQMRAKSKEVEIPASIIRPVSAWAHEMGFTPRRERKLAAIIRASATLNGRTKADENDIMAARFVVPINANGQIEDGAKSLQPLKDAIQQQLHEGGQLAEMGKLSQPVTPASKKEADLIACIKATKARLTELRNYKCVSEKVNKAREAAIVAQEESYQNVSRLLDI
jgi:MoxR-like ATPase